MWLCYVFFFAQVLVAVIAKGRGKLVRTGEFSTLTGVDSIDMDYTKYSL